MIIPIIVAVFAFIAALWLRQIALGWLKRWYQETGWKGFDILRQTTRIPSIIWAVALAAGLGIVVSTLQPPAEPYAAKGLWTLFVLSLGLFALDAAGRLIDISARSVKIEERTVQVVDHVVQVIIVVFTVLALLEVWTLQTSAILVFLGILVLLGLLALREVGPDLVGGLQISSSHHLTAGDYIKLKESDEEGYITHVDWRNTVLKAPNGSVSLIPNRRLARTTIINYGHPVKKAREPFRFFTRLHLKELTAIKARTLKELVEVLKTAPEAVIYYHTHHFLEEHHYLTPQPSNDLAIWVQEALGYDVLAETLASVDTFQYTSIQALRERLVAIIEEYLTQLPYLREAAPGDEFHLIKSVSVILPNGYEASDLREFLEALRKLSPGSLYFHMFESRLRLGRGLNDFSAWLAGSLGEDELARRIARIDPYTVTLEGLRTTIVQLIEKETSETSGL